MTTNSTHLPGLALLMTLAFPLALPAQNPPARDEVRSRMTEHLAEGYITEALALYDAYVGDVKRPDGELLRMIGVAELQRQAAQTNRLVRSRALEGLARNGEAEALASLRQAAGSDAATSHDALAPTLSLVRLGDAAATGRLGALLGSAQPDLKAYIIRALQDANAQSQAFRIAALLDDPLPQVRIPAAVAIGALGYREAIPRLQAMFEGSEPTLRLVAAIALKRLGETTADTFVAKLLASDVPDVRLMAAEAYQPAPRAQWTERIRELRADRNELVRLKAAELLACCDAATARAILSDGLRSPLPSMRAEAARILEAKGLADAPLARRLLGDSSEDVRLYGASAAVRLTGGRPR